MEKYEGMYVVLWMYSLTLHINGQLHERYVGCFQGIGLPATNIDVSEKNGIVSIESCINSCYNETGPHRMTYAALTNGRTCVCSDDYGDQVSDSRCNVSCVGNSSQLCGGTERGQRSIYSVYTVCPVGYFGDGCEMVCHCNGESACIRQTGTCRQGCEEPWNGNSCNTNGCSWTKLSRMALQGTTYNNKGASSLTECQEECRPTSCMSLSFCGSGCWLSNKKFPTGRYDTNNCVYYEYTCPPGDLIPTGCPNGFFGTNCNDRCHCENDDHCPNGSCLHTCKPGWNGTSCNAREVAGQWCSRNSDCRSDETCNVIDLKYINVSRCRCKNGFQTKYSWPNCTDIDECNSTSADCHPTSEICNNTIGSYTCTCKTGFTRVKDSEKCTDVNECERDATVCDLEKEVCQNTIGSYKCIDKSTLIPVYRLGDVVGASLGTAAVLVIAGIIVFLCRRLKRHQQHEVKSEGSKGENPNQMPIDLGDYTSLQKPEGELENTYETIQPSKN